MTRLELGLVNTNRQQTMRPTPERLIEAIIDCDERREAGWLHSCNDAADMDKTESCSAAAFRLEWFALASIEGATYGAPVH